MGEISTSHLFCVLNFLVLTFLWSAICQDYQPSNESHNGLFKNGISDTASNHTQFGIGQVGKNSTKENTGFLDAFISSLSVILVSEIGDKTFFIAAIMAMKHPRLMVFLGAILALGLMTVMSVMLGWAITFIPRTITYYASAALFLIFGLKMLWDGFRMSAHEAQEEFEEVQADLRRRDEEFEAKLNGTSGRKSVDQSDNAVTLIDPLPDVLDKTAECKRNRAPQSEKDTLTRDLEAGKVKSDSRLRICQLLSRIVLTSFTLTFVAEWGDRSQLTTIILAATKDKFGITVGGILGHSICTGVAVIGGRFIAQKISVRTVTLIGGIVFIIFAGMTLLMDSSQPDVKTAV